LDWSGNYRGIIPCADCEGIETTVSLHKDMRFEVMSLYLGRSVKPRLDIGKISWSPDGNSITLIMPTAHIYAKYKVLESKLIQLDMDGKEIGGPHASMYILTKGFYAIQDKYWKLTELNGKPIAIDTMMGKEPHFVLNGGENRFSGNGGCNNISGQYKLTNPDSISFSKTISTMMACPGLQQESSFLKILDKARTYQVSKDKLILRDGDMKIIAAFKRMVTH
jgi:heat shock protein HslJ